MISPTLFFAALLLGTIAVLIAQEIGRGVHRRKLAGLARQWRMHYAADDRFDLAPRVATRLSFPGAADLRVVDLIYGMEDGVRRYVFAAHYTRGVVRAKKRVCCVASICETPNPAGGTWSNLNVSPAELPLLEQYRDMHAATYPLPTA